MYTHIFHAIPWCVNLFGFDLELFLFFTYTEKSASLNLGIKSLDEIRDEKELLARAKKLIGKM